MKKLIQVGFFVSILVISTLHCAEPITTPPKEQPHKSDAKVHETKIHDENREPKDLFIPEPKKTIQLTYHKDIRKIIEKKCQTCHEKGGIGPMEFGSYASIKAYKDSIYSAVSEGRMPPWKADNSCQEYQGNFSLSEKEKSNLLSWLSGDMKEGKEDDNKEEKKEQPVSLPKVSATLKGPEYTPTVKPDDYRCFVIDWSPTKTKFLTGFQIIPGNKKIVHHVIAYYVEPKNVAYYERKAKKDKKGPGFKCFGGVNYSWIGVWAPGNRANVFPKGTGIKFEAGSKVIIQVHYNVLESAPTPDQTKIEFMLEDKVEKEAIMFPWMDFNWPQGKNMTIPAGDASKEHNFFTDIVSLAKWKFGISSITVHDLMLHMHYLGKSAELYIKSPQGKNQCLLNIPTWDFSWQDTYRLKKPITITPGYSLGIRCVHDNSAANQPIINGKKQSPREVTWGEGTTDEMCLGVLYLTCQDDKGNSLPCPKSLR